MGGGGYLLLVLNPPWTPEHKEAILQRVAKGLLSWDVKATGTDLASAEKACLSVKVSAGPHNELLIQHSTESLALEVLLNPEVSTLRQCFKNMMVSGTTHKHVIHAGYAFSGTGDWILQDGVFSARDVEVLLHDAEVEEVLRRQKFHTLHVHCSPEGSWSSQPPTGVSLNPPDIADSLAGSAHLLGCLDAVLTSPPLTSLLPSSSVVGNIRFRRPTMYVFPGGQGDCALFGVTGFTLLVDGGFARKPCFWEFVRHLDRLDSLLVTRFNQFNSCGLTALAQRKALERVYPQVGHVFCNAVRSPSDEELQKDRDQLLVSVVAQGLEFLQGVREMGLSPQACQRDARPLTLFHKVGQGTLEMFVLSPGRVTEEDTSVCVLLVWRPAKASEPVTRILLPGSAPQSVIFDGLSKLGHLAVLRSRAVTAEERLGLKRPKVQDKPLRATSVPPRPSVAKRAAAKGESPSPSPTPPLPEKTKPKVHTNRSVDSLPKKQDEVKRPPAKPTKREPRKPAADKTEAKEEKVAKVTTKVSAKETETTPDKEKMVEKLGENEVDNVEEKDISKLINDKPLKKLPVEIEKIDPKAQEEIVAKVEEKVSAKRELKKATPTRPPAKSKGAKDVTNKMAVEGKTVARKKAEPTKAKPRPVVAPPTRPMVRDSRSKSPSSSASSSPKRAPPKPASERPVRSVRGGVRAAKPTPTEPAKVTEGEKPVVTEKPTAQVKPDKRIEIVTQSGDESSGSKEAIEEKAATEATKEDKPFIEPSSSDESKKDVEKQKPAAIADEVPIKAVLLGTAHAAAPDEDVQKALTRPFEKEIADAEMWPTAGDTKDAAEPGHAMSPEPTISASSEGVPSLVDEVIDVSLQADSSAARPITEPDLSQVHALSSGQRTPDSLDTPREVGDGTAPSSRDEILDAMEKHRLVSREQVLEIKRRDSVDSIEGEIAADEEEVPHETEEAEQKETEKLPQPSLTDKTTSDIMPQAQERPSDVAPSDTVPEPDETKEAGLREEPTPDVPVSAESVKERLELPSPALESTSDETKPGQLDELITEPPVPSDDDKAKASAASVPEGEEEIVVTHIEEKKESLPLGEVNALGEIKLDDIQEKPLPEHTPKEPKQDAGTAPESLEKEPPLEEDLQSPADSKYIRDEMKEKEVEVGPVGEHDVSPRHEEPNVLESATKETADVTTVDAEPLKRELQLQKPKELTSEPTPAVDEHKLDEIEPAELKEPTSESLVSLQPESAKPAEREDAPKEIPQLEKLEPHALEPSGTAGEWETSKIEPAKREEIKAEPPSLQPDREAEVPVSTETEVEQKAPHIDDFSQKEPQLVKPEDLTREHILPLVEERAAAELKSDMTAETMAKTIVTPEHREPDAAITGLPESADDVAAEPEDLKEKKPFVTKPEEHIRDLPSPTAEEHKPGGEEKEEPAALPEHAESEIPVSPVPKDEEAAAKPDDAEAQEPHLEKTEDRGRDVSSPTADKPKVVETKPDEIPEAKEEPTVLPKHEAPEAAEKADTEPEGPKKVEADLKKFDQGTDRVSPAVTEYTTTETEEKEPEKLKGEPASLPEHEEPQPTVSPVPEVVEKTPREQDYLKKQEPQYEIKEDLGSDLPLVADEHKADELQQLEEAESKIEPAGEVEAVVSPATETAIEPSDLKQQEPHIEGPDDRHRAFLPSDVDDHEQKALSPAEVKKPAAAEPLSLQQEQLETAVSHVTEGVEKTTAEPQRAEDSEEHFKKPEDHGRDLPSPGVHDHKVDELMPDDHEMPAEATVPAEDAELEPRVSLVPKADEKAAAKVVDAKGEEPHLEKPGEYGHDVPSPSVDEDKLDKLEPTEKEPEAARAVAPDLPDLKGPEASVSATTEPAGKATVEPEDLREGEKHREKPEDHGVDLSPPAVAEHKLSDMKITEAEEPKAEKELLSEHVLKPAEAQEPEDRKEKEPQLGKPQDYDIDRGSPAVIEHKPSEVKATEPADLGSEPEALPEHEQLKPAVSPISDIPDRMAPEREDVTKEEPLLEKMGDHVGYLPEPSVDEHEPVKLLPTETESKEEIAAAPEFKEPETALSPATEAAGKAPGEPGDLKEKEPHEAKPQEHGVDLDSPAVAEHKPIEMTTEPERTRTEPAALPEYEEPKPGVSPAGDVADKAAPGKKGFIKEKPHLEKKKDDSRDIPSPSVVEHEPEEMKPADTKPKAEPPLVAEHDELDVAVSPVTAAPGKKAAEHEHEHLEEKEPQSKKPEDHDDDLISPALGEPKPSEMKKTEPEEMRAEPASSPEHKETRPLESTMEDVSEKTVPEKKDLTKEPHFEEKEDHGLDLTQPFIDKLVPGKLLPTEAEPETEPTGAPDLQEPEAPVSAVTKAAGKQADEPEGLKEEEPLLEKSEELGVGLESPAIVELKPSEKETEPEGTKPESAALPKHEEPKSVVSPAGELADKAAPEKKVFIKEEPHLEKKGEDGRDIPSPSVVEHELEKVKPADIKPSAEPPLVAEHDELEAAVSPVTTAAGKKAAEPEHLEEKEPHSEKPEDHDADLGSPTLGEHEPSEMKTTKPDEVKAELVSSPEPKEPKSVVSPMVDVSEKTAPETKGRTEEEPRLEKKDHGPDLTEPSADKLMPEKLLPTETEPQAAPTGASELEEPKPAVGTVTEAPVKKAGEPEDITKEESDSAKQEDRGIPSPSVDEQEAGELKPSETEPKTEPAVTPVLEEFKAAVSSVTESPEKKGAEPEDFKQKEPHLEKPEGSGIDFGSPTVPERKSSETKATEPEKSGIEPASLSEHKEPKPAASSLSEATDKAAPKTEDLTEQTQLLDEKQVQGHDILPLSAHDHKADELKPTDVEKAKEIFVFPEDKKPQAAVSPPLYAEDITVQPEKSKEHEIFTEKPEDELVSEPEDLKKEPRFDEPEDHDRDSRLPLVDEHKAKKMEITAPKDLQAESPDSPQRKTPEAAKSPLLGVSAETSPEPERPKSEEPLLGETALRDGLESPAVDSYKPDELKLAGIEEPTVLPEHEKPQTAAVLPSEVVEKTDAEPEDLKKQKPDVEKREDYGRSFQSPAVDDSKYGDLMPTDFAQTIEKAVASPEHKESEVPASPLGEVAGKTVAEPEDLKMLESHFEHPEHEKPEAALSPVPKVSDKAAPQPADLHYQEPKMEGAEDRVRDFPSPTDDSHKTAEFKPTETGDSKVDYGVLPEHKKPEEAVRPMPEVVEKTSVQPENLKKQEPHLEEPDDRLHDLPLADLEHKTGEFKPQEREEAGEKPAVLTDQAQPEAPSSPEPKADDKLAIKSEETKEQKPHLKEPEDHGPDILSPAADEHKQGNLTSTVFEPEAKPTVLPEQEEQEFPVSPVSKGTDKAVSESEDLQKKEAHLEEPESHGIEPTVSSLLEVAQKPAHEREDSKKEPIFEKEDRDHEPSFAADEHKVDEFKPTHIAGLKAEPAVLPEHKEPEAVVSPISKAAEKGAAQPDDLQKQEQHLERPEDYNRDLSSPGVDEHKADEFKPDECEDARADQAVVSERVKPQTPESPMQEVEGIVQKYEHDKQQEPHLEKPDHVPCIPSPALDEQEPAEHKPAGREEPRVEPDLPPEHEEPEVHVILAPRDTDIAATEAEDKKREPLLGKPEDRGHQVAPPCVDKHKPGELKPDVTDEAGAKTAAFHDHEEPKDGVSAIPEATEKQLPAAEDVKKGDAHLEKPDSLARELPSPSVDEVKPSEFISAELEEPKAQPTELPKHEHPDVASSPVPEVSEKPSVEPADLEQGKVHFVEPELPQRVVDEPELREVKPDELEQQTAGRVFSERKDPGTVGFSVPEAADKEAPASEYLKKLEPHLERPVEQARQSPSPTVDELKPEEGRPAEPDELDADFLQQKTPEVASSPLPEVGGETELAPDHEKKQKPGLEEPEDHVSDLPSPAADEPKQEEFKPHESKGLETAPSIFSARKEPESAFHSVPKAADITPTVPEDIKDQEGHLGKPEEPTRDIASTADHHMPDDLVLAKPEEQEPTPAVFSERKEPESVLRPVPEDADKKAAMTEDLKKHEPHLEQRKDHAQELTSAPLDADKTGDFKRAELEEQGVEPKVLYEHKKPEFSASTTPDTADESAAAPEDLKKHEPQWEEPRDEPHDLVSPEPREFLPADVEERSAEPAVLPEYKDTQARVSAVPDAVDKSVASPEGLKRSEPPLEDRDHSPVVDEHEVVEREPAMPGEPTRTPAVFPDHEKHEAALGTVPEVTDKKAAVPEFSKEQATYLEEPKDHSHSVSSPGANEQKPQEPETAEVQKPETEPILFELKESVVAPSTVAEVADSKAAEREDFEQEPQLQKPEHSGRDSPSAVDEHITDEQKPDELKEPKTEPGALSKPKQPEEAGIQVPESVDKKASVPDEVKEQEPRLEKPEDHGRDLHLSAAEGHILDALKRDELEPATPPHRHEPEVPVPHDVKPDSGQSPTEVSVVHEHEPGAEPSGKLPKYSSFDAEGIVTTPGEEMVDETTGSVKDEHEPRKSITEVQEIEDYEPQVEEAELQGIVTSPRQSVTDSVQGLPVDSGEDEKYEGIRITELPGIHQEEHICKAGQELPSDVLKDSDQTLLQDTAEKQPSDTDSYDATSPKPEVPRSSSVTEDYEALEATTLIPEVDGTIAEDLIAAKEKAQQQLQDYTKDGTLSLVCPTSVIESDVTLETSTKDIAAQLKEEIPDTAEQRKSFPDIEKVSELTDDSYDPLKHTSQHLFQDRSEGALSSEDHLRSAEPTIDHRVQLPSDARERTDSSEDVHGSRKAEPDKATAPPHDQVYFEDEQEIMKVVQVSPKSPELKKDLPSSKVPEAEEAEPLKRQSADGLPETKSDITEKQPLSSAETCPPTSKPTGPEVTEAVSHDTPKGSEAEPVPSPEGHECSKQEGAPGATAATPVEPPQADHGKMPATEDAKGSGELEPSPPLSETKHYPSEEKLPDTTRTDEATSLPAYSERSMVGAAPAETSSGKIGDVWEPSEVPHKEKPQDKCPTPELAEPPQPTASSSAGPVEAPLHPSTKPYDTNAQIASQEDRDVPDSKEKRDDMLQAIQAESVTHKDATPLDASREPRKETELQTDTVKEAAQPSIVKEKADVGDDFAIQPDRKAQEVPEDACLKSTDASTPKDGAQSTSLAPETVGDGGRAPTSTEGLESDPCRGDITLPCDASVVAQTTAAITVEREIIKPDLHLPLEAPAAVGGAYSKARELLDEFVSGVDSTSPGGAISTGSPKSSVSEESVPSVVPKDDGEDASAKEKERDDKTCDEDVAPCSGVTTGYDFRSPSEVLKRDFLEETSNTLGKDVYRSIVMLSPSQDEEGRRLLEIVKSQLICDDSTCFDVTTGKEDLPGTKDIPPADSTKDVTDRHVAGRSSEETKLSSESVEKDDEMLAHIMDQITKEESHDVTLAVPQKLQISEGTDEKPLSLAQDDKVEPVSHADIPLSSQDQRRLSSPEQLPLEGAPQDEESSSTPRASAFEKARGDLQDEGRLDRPTEVFHDARQESLVQESEHVEMVSSEIAKDKSSKPEIRASQTPTATKSFQTPEDSRHHIPSDLAATPAEDLGSSPVALKESTELPEMALLSGKDKESGSICEVPSYDSEIALTKGLIFDARLSSGSEGVKARGEAQFGEDPSVSTLLAPQKQDSYDLDTPWAEHRTPRRDSQELPPLEIQDQPMKDPRAACPTALDTPELAHMQQRLSVEYESSITSVSEIEFTVDVKASGAPTSDSSSRDDSKAADASKDQVGTSRASSPESPPQSPVKRLAAEHPRASKRSRTASESKHPISTQGSSEADISSEDEDSAKKGLSRHHTPASTDDGDTRKESVTPEKPPSPVQPAGVQVLGVTSRPSLETETTSSSDDTTSGPAFCAPKDNELMREYSKHLETFPSSRFSLDSTCSVTSEERSYAELEKPYQRDYSLESFSSTSREYPQDSSRSGSLYSDSTLEPLSTADRCEVERPGGPVPDTASPTTERRQPAATIPHSHGIASGLFAALKTELCVIDSPSMDSVLDQTGKDGQPLTDQPTSLTSPKVPEEYKEPHAADIKQPESVPEALSDHGHIDGGREIETEQRDLSEAPEQISDKEPRKTHPVPPLTSVKTPPASGSEAAVGDDVEPFVPRKISGEITPSKTIRFQLPEEVMKGVPTDQSCKDSPASRALLDEENESKEMFELAVRLEQLNEAEFLESMATDEEDDLSRGSLKPSTSSTPSPSRHEGSHKPAEPDEDGTEDEVTLASALSSGLPTELVCLAQSSVDISKDISRIAKCADSLELVTSPPRSPQDAGKHDEPAAVAAGLASGLPVELVCMVESKELCSEIKRAEEEAIHHVIEKKSDYAEDANGVAMQTYIERRLSESDYSTDKQPLASPTLKSEPTSTTGEPTPGQKPGKEFDDLQLNGTSHSPPSVGLVAGLAAGLATELVCMPQSAEELCIEAAESSRSSRGSQAEVIPPEMAASMYEERTEHLDEKLPSAVDGVEYSERSVPGSTVPPRIGQIPVQREVITTVTSRRVVYQNDGPPDTWTTSTLSDTPEHDAEDDSKRTTVTYVYRTYTSGEGEDKEGPVLSSGSVPSRFDDDDLQFDVLRSSIARHAREEEANIEEDQGTGSTTRRYVYTVSSDHGAPEMFIRQSDDSDSTSHPDSSIHNIAMDEVARITEMAAAAVSQSPNGWTVVHRSADSSSQRPLELTRPTELVDRRNGHVTHVTETRQIVYHPSTSGELRFPLGRSAEETCLPPEGSDPKTILEFMAAQTKQAAKEMLEEQPLYEEDEEAALEQSSLSDASPLVEEPVFAKTLQPDYPELVELSAGNTPSEPPSPHSAVHDGRARHNGEPGVTSVQRMVVVEETEPPSTPGRSSQARRVVSYVEEPTTVVREEWVLEGGQGEAPQVISQSSMFHHEILTVEGSTSTTPSHTSGGDPVRFTHHFERDIGAADDVLQQSSLKASAAVHAQQEWSRGAAESTGAAIAAAATAPREDDVRELQAATERRANGRPDADAAPFDIRDWGKPLGLPVPPDPSSKSSSKTGRKTVPRNASDVVYVDLTYVPYHGDPGYCDAEFFSRVRARYYVLSSTNPSQQVLDALLEAKRGWGEPDAPVTVIPTYETDALCYWIAHNQKALEEHHIDVAPSASRCTINLQDHESSCAAYRLEF
ncbi:uncharacterized protein LOC144121313 [Amblyomma americanum]